jgi:cation:H+ antiporter
MFDNILLLVMGMFLLVKGADWFVGGASVIAKALKIPSLIIGLTLVSMGTSLPEASVSIQGSLNGLNDISIGNVVGSNIFNTLLILGLCSLFIPIAIDKDMKKFDIPILIGLYAILILFCFVITPNFISRWQGIVLVVLFIAYMVFLVLRAKKNPLKTLEETEKDSDNKDNKKPLWLSIVMALLGLGAIVLGGDLVVDKASLIAIELGMSEALVGLTIVAVGTSLPELITSVTAAKKGSADIAIGNIVGSNIFNILFVVGTTALITPVVYAQSFLVDSVVAVVTMVVLWLLVLNKDRKLKRWGGAI